jgi:hypothetical protein
LRCKRSSAAVANLGGCGTLGALVGGMLVGEPDIFCLRSLEAHSLLGFGVVEANIPIELVNRFGLLQRAKPGTLKPSIQPKRKKA